MALHTPFALTSMPKDPILVQDKLQKAILSFQSNTKPSDEGQYLFVLEKMDTKEIVGLSALYTNVGFNSPIYYYRILHEELPNLPETLIPYEVPQKVLQAVPAGEGSTEIGTLFLKHEYRKEGLAPLLSLSRFLFVAAYPHLFADKIHANMRGFFDENTLPPFWEEFGRRFFDIEYNHLIDLIQHDCELTHHILPVYPIYFSLIPERAREVIGKTHLHTVGALKILNEEGFQWTMHIDPFDAGPLISCHTDSIRVVSTSRIARVKSVSGTIQSNTRYLVSTHKQSFRVCYAKLDILDDYEVVLDKDAAEHLQIGPGSSIRYVTAKHGVS
jgi:arginine N-succinyltransferase